MDYYKSYLRSIVRMRALSVSILLLLAGLLLNPQVAPALEKPIPTLGVGLPQPYTLGLRYLWNERWNATLGGGYAPIPFVLNGNLSVGHVESWVHWHPWAGSFFLNAGLGYQSIQYRMMLNLGALAGDGVPRQGILNLDSLFFGLGLGWRWQVTSKLFLGADLGAQIPVLSSGGIRVSGNSESDQNLSSAAADPLGYYASYIMPRIHLLRIDWMF